VGSTPDDFANIIVREIGSNKRLAAKIGLEPQ